MELAIHIRDLDQGYALGNTFPHLEAFYPAGAMQEQDWSELIAAKSVRAYIGDEFCSHRLPHIDELERVCRSLTDKNGELTFLTPPLTDEGLERSTPLFEFLKANDPHAEVVVNDWGGLLFLQQNYPQFRLSLGRLLNKGFKDPRLTNPGEASGFSAETAELFNACTFDVAEFVEKMQQLNVMRLERDLFPYGDPEIQSCGGLAMSVYFPFGYISTGRVCRIAAFSASTQKKYSIPNGCRHPCQKMSLKLNHTGTNQQLFQSGNTIFYLYAPSKLVALINQAKTQNIRLVYQGLLV